jgi:hypothetical protein
MQKLDGGCGVPEVRVAAAVLTVLTVLLMLQQLHWLLDAVQHERRRLLVHAENRLQLLVSSRQAQSVGLAHVLAALQRCDGGPLLLFERDIGATLLTLENFLCKMLLSNLASFE